MPSSPPRPVLLAVAACLVAALVGCGDESAADAPPAVDEAAFMELKREAIAVHERGRNRAKAIDLLEEVASLRPGQAGIHRRLGQLHTELKNNDDALRHHELALEAAPGDLTSAAAVVALRRQTGNDEGVEELIDLLVASDTHRGDGLYYRAHRHYQAGRIDETLATLDQARGLPSSSAYRCASLHGVVLVEEGRFEEALERFEAALRGRADYKETLNGLALVHRRLGHDEQADRWQRIHRLFLDLTDDVYMKSRKRAGDRAEVLEEITRAYPEWTDGFRDLADLYVKHGNVKAACATIERLVEVNPSMPSSVRTQLVKQYCGGRP